jgi:hypothetical protein
MYLYVAYHYNGVADRLFVVCNHCSGESISSFHRIDHISSQFLNDNGLPKFLYLMVGNLPLLETNRSPQSAQRTRILQQTVVLFPWLLCVFVCRGCNTKSRWWIGLTIFLNQAMANYISERRKLLIWALNRPADSRNRSLCEIFRPIQLSSGFRPKEMVDFGLLLRISIG